MSYVICLKQRREPQQNIPEKKKHVSLTGKGNIIEKSSKLNLSLLWSQQLQVISQQHVALTSSNQKGYGCHP